MNRQSKSIFADKVASAFTERIECLIPRILATAKDLVSPMSDAKLVGLVPNSNHLRISVQLSKSFWGNKIVFKPVNHGGPRDYFASYCKPDDVEFRRLIERMSSFTGEEESIRSFVMSRLRFEFGPLAHKCRGKVKWLHDGKEIVRRYLMALYSFELARELDVTRDYLKSISKVPDSKTPKTLTDQEIESLSIENFPIETFVDIAVSNSLYSSSSLAAIENFGHVREVRSDLLAGSPIVEKFNEEFKSQTNKVLAKLSKERESQIQVIQSNLGLRNIELVHDPETFDCRLRLIDRVNETSWPNNNCHFEYAFFENAIAKEAPWIGGRFNTPKGHQFLSMLDSWLTLERLAEVSLQSGGILHMLPPRLEFTTAVNTSLEQCLRAAPCGDLVAILCQAKRLPPFMKLNEEYRLALLQPYRLYLSVAARHLESTRGKSDTIRFLFELLSTLFQHRPVSRRSGDDLLEYCEDLFSDRLQFYPIPQVEEVPVEAVEPIDPFDAFLKNEEALDQKMKLILQSLPEGQIRSDFEVAITDAKQNRWNAFMNVLLETSQSDSKTDGTIERIKAAMQGSKL